MTINLLSGSEVVATIFNATWIEEEQSYYGRTADGDYYYAWNLVDYKTAALCYRRVTW